MQKKTKDLKKNKKDDVVRKVGVKSKNSKTTR